MAKVKAPLHSHEARGKLADSLVYFPWKGINVVREYVIPTNPKTAGQITQRGYVTSAVGGWHSTLPNILDRAAWTRLASISKKTMTGFNRFVQFWISCMLASKTAAWLFAYENTAKTTTTITSEIDSGASVTGLWCRYGTSKTAMISIKECTGGPSPWEIALTGLSVGTKYFLQFYATAGAAYDMVVSGIYTETTSAS